jgi:hypothetical protein
MSFSTLIWDYPSPSSASPPVTSASVSSTSVASSPPSPPDSSFQVQSQPMSSENTPTISTPPGTVDPADITTTPTTSAKKKKQLLPSYPVHLREEDDWTKVKDPKEKKKIQNRVAQRTYRMPSIFLLNIFHIYFLLQQLITIYLRRHSNCKGGVYFTNYGIKFI